MPGRRRCESTAKSAEANVDETAAVPEAVLAIRLLKGGRCAGLKPTELASLYRRLMGLKGWSITRLSKELSLTQPTVTRALKLLELPEVVQRQIDQGVLSPAAAYEISKLDHPGDQVDVAAQVAAERIRRDEVRSLVQAKKSGRGAAVAGWRRVELRAGPFIFMIAGPIGDGAALREAGLEVLGRLSEGRVIQ